ncbi:monoacylglycerol lipase abhd6-A-like [Corythoichthys intestinalis]|uniref:monoacylglycerol lipase abhd6-A-like n=1 Tax=Corythoichthys intestinalis TaxID=161448 RepID=UPI0025A52196|nr:monoacylglycerol lipase abhd6-A-like [Corythoichthys intestinalis]XP_061814247.1 monoacylglycerol lipase abhd6-A-like [Nerophis lumbriciformis]
MEPSVGATMMLMGSILALPFLTFFTAVRIWPSLIIRAYNWWMRLKLGLTIRYSYSGGYCFCYFTRGTPGGTTPSLLLLHGFSASKDMWLPFVKYLPVDQHVLCVDMPGHEGTSRTGSDDYSIRGQVARIHQFVQSVGLDKRPFHLVGTSMGGNVAGVYAATYQPYLSGVTLMCPSGLVYPTETEFIVRLREMEKNPGDYSISLIPSTDQELEDMLRLCCYKPLKLPRQVLRGLLDNRMRHNHFYKELFMELVEEKSRHSLQEALHLITSPLQVIWGKQDKVLDASGASALKAGVPHSQLFLLDDCGHTIALERPRTAAQLVMDFLSAQKVCNKNVEEKNSGDYK